MARPTTLEPDSWKSIDTVLLDLDGTLLDLAFDNNFWKKEVPVFYADSQGISLQQSQEYLNQCYKDYSGTLDWYCTDFWSEKLGLDIIAHKIKLSDQIALRPGTKEFLDNVKASHRQLVLVTNAHPDTLRIKLEKTGLHQYFDALYSSHEFKQPKESPLFWSQLELKLNSTLSRCLFIDDTESILLRAQQSGVKFVVMVEQPDMSQPPKKELPFPSVNKLIELIESEHTLNSREINS